MWHCAGSWNSPLTSDLPPVTGETKELNRDRQEAFDIRTEHTQITVDDDGQEVGGESAHPRAAAPPPTAFLDEGDES